MVVKEKPMKQVLVKLDDNTLNRFKVLSGPKPVARYLRELSLALTQDTPPSLDDLKGGESITSVRQQLQVLVAAIERQGEIQVSHFEKLLKMVLQLASMTNYTLDAVDQLHPEYGLADDIREKAKRDGEKWYQEEINKFYPMTG